MMIVTISGLTRYGICLNFYRRFETVRVAGRPSTENYQILSGDDITGVAGTTATTQRIGRTSSDSAFSR
jgi:hypothetical protein